MHRNSQNLIIESTHPMQALFQIRSACYCEHVGHSIYCDSCNACQGHNDNVETDCRDTQKPEGQD